jgi:DNA repair protein RadB
VVLPLCSEVVDALSRPGVILVYGESGVGKTTLALELVRLFCSTRCLYVSTERLDFLRRAETMGLDLSRLVVYDAVDAADFLDVVTRRSLILEDMVVVDSINSFIGEGELARRLTGLAAAALHDAGERYGLRVVETAQVRWTPEGELPAAWRMLELWADTVVELRYTREPGVREARIGGRVYRYRLRGDGMEWLSC